MKFYILPCVLYLHNMAARCNVFRGTPFGQTENTVLHENLELQQGIPLQRTKVIAL